MIGLAGSGECESDKIDIPRQQLFDLMDRMTDNAGQRIGEMRFQFKGIQFSRVS
jgi:hypothetical protein